MPAIVSYAASVKARRQPTHLDGPFAGAGADVQDAARVLERSKVVPELEQHLYDLVLDVHAVELGLHVDGQQLARIGSGRAPYTWSLGNGYAVASSVKPSLPPGAGRSLTAGLVAVIGPAVFAHIVEDALVDRFGAPGRRQQGQLSGIMEARLTCHSSAFHPKPRTTWPRSR